MNVGVIKAPQVLKCQNYIRQNDLFCSFSKILSRHFTRYMICIQVYMWVCVCVCVCVYVSVCVCTYRYASDRLQRAVAQYTLSLTLACWLLPRGNSPSVWVWYTIMDSWTVRRQNNHVISTIHTLVVLKLPKKISYELLTFFIISVQFLCSPCLLHPSLLPRVPATLGYTRLVTRNVGVATHFGARPLIKVRANLNLAGTLPAKAGKRCGLFQKKVGVVIRAWLRLLIMLFVCFWCMLGKKTSMSLNVMVNLILNRYYGLLLQLSWFHYIYWNIILLLILLLIVHFTWCLVQQ